MAPTPALVSCLCVTEHREEFMPWLLWCFDRQTWARKELVIVDSSPTIWRPPQRQDVSVLRARSGTSVAAKRNQALAAARGDAVAWTDDDDWQHPQRLATLLERLTDRSPIVGPSASHLVELFSDRVWFYPGFANTPLFNGVLMKTELARSVPFDVHLSRASDTAWLKNVVRIVTTRGFQVTDLPTFFWLFHHDNLSISPRRAGLRRSLERTTLGSLKSQVGSAAWGDTDRQLALLRTRLKETQTRLVNRRLLRR
jgi:glycosyltransferase involved in cell wall biosynthesis